MARRSMTTMPPHDSYEPGSAEEVLMNAAAALDLPDLNEVDWSTLTRAETKALMAARRSTPEALAKAARRDAEPPAGGAARRRWRANDHRQTPPPNAHAVTRDTLDLVIAAGGAALHADGTLQQLQAAEDAAIDALARDVELPKLEDLEQALADKRAARPALLAREKDQAARLAQAQAQAQADRAALNDILAEGGYDLTTPIPRITPSFLRLRVVDAGQRVGASTELVSKLMTAGVGNEVGFDENVRQSTALLRQIAAHKVSEMRGKR